MVLAIANIYFFSYFQRVAIPGTIFNDLQCEFSISAGDVTLLSTIYLSIYAFMQPFAGLLADRFGGIRIALLSGVLMCAGSIIFPMSSGIMGLYFSRALVGLGASTIYLCLIKEADLSFGGRNFAPIVGFLSLLGYSGGLAGTRPFRMMVEWLGWRNSCMAIAIISCFALAFAWLITRKITRKDKIAQNSHIWNRMIIVMKNSFNYPILVPWTICFAIYFNIQTTIGTKFLEDLCGVTPLQSSSYTFVMMLVTMTTLFFSGFVSRFFGNNRKAFLIFASAATLIATAGLLFGTIIRMPPSFFLSAYILLAITSGICPVVVSMTAENNREDAVAIAIGLLNTVTYVMVAMFSQLIGKVLDMFKASVNLSGKTIIYPPVAYIMIFSIMLAFAVIAVISSLYSRETHGQNIASGIKN